MTKTVELEGLVTSAEPANYCLMFTLQDHKGNLYTALYHTRDVLSNEAWQIANSIKNKKVKIKAMLAGDIYARSYDVIGPIQILDK